VRRPYNRSGAIVANLDAESFLEFRKKTGFGKMIQDVGNYGGIVYIVFQDEKDIIAANRKADGLSKINNDVFLQKALASNEPMTRINNFEGKQVYEAVKAFVVDGQKQGIIRIALNMDEILSVEDRMLRRMIIMSLILIAIAVSSIGLITSGQNYKILSGKYEKIRSFTGDILENMSQGVITGDKDGTVTIFNKSAVDIFGIARVWFLPIFSRAAKTSLFSRLSTCSVIVRDESSAIEPASLIRLLKTDGKSSAVISSFLDKTIE